MHWKSPAHWAVFTAEQFPNLPYFLQVEQVLRLLSRCWNSWKPKLVSSQFNCITAQQQPKMWSNWIESMPIKILKFNHLLVFQTKNRRNIQRDLLPNGLP